MDNMQITHEIENQCCVKRGVKGVPAPIPQEGEWTKCKEIKDISGLTHGCGCCAPQQGTCKLTLNVKNGIIQEALVEPKFPDATHHETTGVSILQKQFFKAL